jgi:hypothetical protein
LVIHDCHEDRDVGFMDGLNEPSEFDSGRVVRDVLASGYSHVERLRDGVIGLTWVDEDDALPPGKNLLLDPFIRLTEIVVNLEVDGATELVERRLKVGLKQMVQSEIKGVRDENHNLVELEGFCIELKDGLSILCGWLIAGCFGCTFLDLDMRTRNHRGARVTDVPESHF